MVTRFYRPAVVTGQNPTNYNINVTVVGFKQPFFLKYYQHRTVEMKKSLGVGYQLCNIVDHHGWLTEKIFCFKLPKTAIKT